MDDARVVMLGEAHLAGCLALSKSANWNQNEADWRLMLGFGCGWGVTLEDGTLAASTLLLPYGKSFAWVAMVLVLPEHRRRGFATQLLKKALEENSGAGRTSILDATPAGMEVYKQEGFRGTWGFKRYQWTDPAKRGPAMISGVSIRQIGEADWDALLALDTRAFGASREPVLRDLARRLPQVAMLAHRGGEPLGFVLGREGREAVQIGPLVATEAAVASTLLGLALARVKPPVYLDLVDREAALQAWLAARGFEFQRPFTRMVHATSGPAVVNDRLQPPGPGAPGEAGLVYCPAGPELG